MRPFFRQISCLAAPELDSPSISASKASALYPNNRAFTTKLNTWPKHRTLRFFGSNPSASAISSISVSIFPALSSVIYPTLSSTS
ncbi:hypothetical protein HZ326_30300 [Fusarium oxysporum f. sp. albedinis]|nr:hypothetical protein HZ326_30300 [Fusarium oxysporum f. sp. albedinis]